MTDHKYKALQLLKELRGSVERKYNALKLVETYIDIPNIQDKLISMAMLENTEGLRLVASIICQKHKLKYKGKPICYRKKSKHSKHPTQDCVSKIYNVFLYFKNRGELCTLDQFIEKYEQLYKNNFLYIKYKYDDVSDWFCKQTSMIQDIGCVISNQSKESPFADEILNIMDNESLKSKVYEVFNLSQTGYKNRKLDAQKLLKVKNTFNTTQPELFENVIGTNEETIQKLYKQYKVYRHSLKREQNSIVITDK